jgi:hypothetical protein
VVLVSKNLPDLGAPLRNRTVDLLLTIYPRADAVAICDDAAQVRGGARCCRPTYLVITPGPGSPGTAPTGRRPGRSLPHRQSRRPAAAARAGRNGRPPGHRAAGAGRRSPHAQPRGNQPCAIPHRQHRTARPGPAGHQTQPRHPARPAQGRPDLSMSGSRGRCSDAAHRTAAPESLAHPGELALSRNEILGA